MVLISALLYIVHIYVYMCTVYVSSILVIKLLKTFKSNLYAGGFIVTILTNVGDV